MKTRRLFLLLLNCFLVFFLAGCAPPPGSADSSSHVPSQTTNDEPFKSGTHYRPISLKADPHLVAPNITIYFWYGCPHCASLDPLLEAWLKKQSSPLSVAREHPVISSKWVNHGRLFYALQVLGAKDKIHSMIFGLVQDKHLDGNDLINAAAELSGFSASQINSTMSSLAVDIAIKQIKDEAVALKLPGVPAIVVNDKHLVLTSNVSSYQEILDITDYLLTL